MFHLLQKLLQNNVVDGVISSMLGVPAKEITDGFYFVENMDKNQLGNISHLAQLLYNYTSCIEVDRFIGYASEAELLKAAGDLHKDNKFLAGLWNLSL